MNRALIAVAAFTPASLCAAGAVYLASCGTDGWGWFLFAVVCLSPSLKWDEKKSPDGSTTSTKGGDHD